jgi:hypothetical protein
MSVFLNQVVAAMRRVDRRLQPEPKDVEIIKPLLVGLAEKLSSDGPIRFVQVGRDFVIDATNFPALHGYRYIRTLLMEPGEHISCGRLNPAAVSTSQQKMLTYSDVRRLRDRADVLRGSIFAAQCGGIIQPDKELEAIDELKFIDWYLDESTHKGKIKSFVSESDKVRQSVNKAINLALTRIENNPDTRHIGEHLRKNIKLGYRCAYLGGWKWKF